MTTYKRADAVRKLNLIERFAEKGHMLDVGFGDGEILIEARNRGWKVSGLEKDLEKVKEAKKHKIRAVREDDIDDIFNEESFDCIVMQSVLQYVSDPEDYISYAYKFLKPNGILFLTTLNKWHFMNWFKPRVQLFSVNTIRRYLENFKIIELRAYKNSIRVVARKMII